MGAEIQSERNLNGCSPIWGIHRSAKNDMWSLYQEDRTKKNGQCFEPLLQWQMKNLDEGVLEYDKEKVKQTILKHESTFRHQLQELHRLYGRQRELMNMFARKEVEPGAANFSPFSSHIASEDNKRGRHGPHVPPAHLIFGQSSQSEISCKQSFHGFSKDTNMMIPFPSKGIVSPRKVIDLEIPADATDNGGKMSPCNALNDAHNGDVSRSFLPMKRRYELADLNEPILIDDTTDSGSANDPGHLSGNRVDIKREDKSATPNSVLKRNSSNGSCFKSFQSMNGMDRNERLSRDFNSKSTQPQNISRDSSVAFQSSKDEDKKLNGISTSVQDLTGNRRKRKLFGVEIFEVNDQSHLHVKSGIDSSSRSFGSSLGNSLPNLNLISNTRASDFVPEESSHVDLVKSVEHLDPAKVSRLSEENPFHRVDNIYGAEQPRANKNVLHLNLESLQNCSHQFFKNNAPLSSQKLMQKAEKVLTVCTREIDASKHEVHLPSSTTMIKDFPTSNGPRISQDLNIATKSSESSVDDGSNAGDVQIKCLNSEAPINIIDLNLSLVEEDPAITEVELGAPAVPVSSDAPNEPCEELMRLAAEAIVAISVSAEEDIIDHEPCNHSSQERSNERLQWFVEVVSSHECHDTNLEMIPGGMDDFEYMALKLEDTKSDDHFYHTYPAPFMENDQDEEEETKVTALSRRPRRGQARRGRQKKDFQRDVLPGIVSLSKLQVVEDFQTFQELMKASGSTWQSSLSRRSSGKSSRGRRRRATMPPQAHPVAEQKPVSEEDKTLTGWGKRTRRLPRQRHGNGTSTSSTKNSQLA